jgi:hypothetical protein
MTRGARLEKVSRAAGGLRWGWSWVLAVAALAGCVSTARAAPRWQRPVNVSAPLQGADSPVVAMNLAGDTVVVWVDQDAGVEAVVRRAGGPFSAPRKVASGVVDTGVNYPAVEIDEAGNAIAVWQRDDEYDDKGSVQAAVLPASGRFRRPVTLSRRQPYGASIAMNAAGDAIVTWTAKTKSGEVVQAATRAARGSFSSTINLSADGEPASFSDVAMNAAGDAIVAWPRGPLKAQILQASVRPAGGGFSQPVNLSAAGQDADAARVAIDSAGNAIAVWNRFDGANFIVQAATRPVRGDFSVPIDLSATGRDGVHADLAFDAAGAAIVTWIREDLFKLKSNGVVQMSTLSPGGTFSGPFDVSGAGYDAEYPGLAMNPAGAAIAVWDRATQDIVYSTGVQAALHAPGGSFSTPATLSRGAEKVGYPPQVAIDRSGNAIVVWLSSRDGGSLQAAVYQEAALPPAAVAARLSGLRLSSSAFSAARSGPAVAASAARGGSRVSYALSIAARVRFTVERASTGRIVGGRCAPSTNANRRCRRFVAVPGSFTRDRSAGRDRFTFTGRLAGRRLKAGRYRLVALPSVAGHIGQAARASFRIVR